jgi:nucleoside-diphosphate-sugar epimerase
VRIFLTGGTGYIGRALAARLVASGHEVRALVRATSRTEALTSLGVATFVGDLADRFSMRVGMSGSDWVIHAAAELDPRADPATLRAINVVGSENVASLAYKLGVRRFLAVSSMAAFGGSPPDGTPATEQSAPQLPRPTGYSRTKHEGDEAIAGWRRRGLKVNTVFPSMVYGPPGKKAGANFFLRQVLKGRYPFLLGGERRVSWIFLEDLVDGLLSVVAKAPANRDYLMTGDVATNRALFARIGELGGVRPPQRSLPMPVARLLLALSKPWFRLRGHQPPITAEQIRNLDRHWAFDDRRAREELGWQPRSLEAGLPPTINHLLAAEDSAPRP